MKYEVTDAMVEAAIRGHLSNDEYMYDMRAAITAAIEASGLVERIAELEDGEKQVAKQWNRLQDLLQSYEAKCKEHGIQLIDWQEFKLEEPTQ